MKITNLSRYGCFDFRVETRKMSFIIQKAKDWGRTKKVILPKRLNPFLRKYVVYIFI